MHFASDEGATITVELIGGSLGRPVTLEEDGLIIMRITSKSEVIEVIATSTDGITNKQRYTLENIVLQEA